MYPDGYVTPPSGDYLGNNLGFGLPGGLLLGRFSPTFYVFLLIFGFVILLKYLDKEV